MKSLREQMNDAMILRGFAARTQESYLAAVTALAKYYHRSPDTLTEEEVSSSSLPIAALSELAVDTQPQTLTIPIGSALRWFSSTRFICRHCKSRV